MFGSLEEEESRGGVEGKRVEWNDSPLPCLDIFKISKRGME